MQSLIYRSLAVLESLWESLQGKGKSDSGGSSEEGQSVVVAARVVAVAEGKE